MKWTEERVATAIAKTLFDWRRNVVVPNLSWGMGLGFEIDLGVLTESGWLTEVEIKVSVADLRNDVKKFRHRKDEASAGRDETTIRRKYFAMPYDIDMKRKVAGVSIPDGCGLIVVDGGARGDTAKITLEAAIRPNARKLRPDEREKMLRLGYIRFWAQRDATALVHAGITRVLEEIITKEAVPA